MLFAMIIWASHVRLVVPTFIPYHGESFISMHWPTIRKANLYNCLYILASIECVNVRKGHIFIDACLLPVSAAHVGWQVAWKSCRNEGFRLLELAGDEYMVAYNNLPPTYITLSRWLGCLANQSSTSRNWYHGDEMQPVGWIPSGGITPYPGSQYPTCGRIGKNGSGAIEWFDKPCTLTLYYTCMALLAEG